MAKTYRSTTNSVRALKNCLAFSSRDWGLNRGDAWLYGIILGWDDKDDPDDGAMSQIADSHGWDEFDVANLRKLHEHFEQLSETDGEDYPLPGDHA